MKLLFLSNVSNSLIKFHRKSSSSVGSVVVAAAAVLFFFQNLHLAVRQRLKVVHDTKKGAGFSYSSGKMLNPTSVSRFGSMHTNRILRDETREVLQTIFFYFYYFFLLPNSLVSVLGMGEPFFLSVRHSPKPKSINEKIAIT